MADEHTSAWKYGRTISLPHSNKDVCLYCEVQFFG